GDRIVVMQDGIIQQAASPEELYNNPNNLFVAGFIGSPTMNFINGTLSESNGSVRFKSQGLDVEVPGGKAQILKSKGFIGKEVIMGVRPEDIHEEPVFLEASPNTIFTAHVDVTENLGHEMLLYLSGLGNDTVIARVDGRSTTREGNSARLAVDMNKIHIFDKESELNVLLAD
ncbi:TOBE domain-containing protein, partial [Paenibacillus sp. AR247]|uniref:TOBE domain-containing protein n=1 Tax=Paenibacillus sp. AR247 TaxID=1631599 RepID=UPI0021579811